MSKIDINCGQMDVPQDGEPDWVVNFRHRMRGRDWSVAVSLANESPTGIIHIDDMLFALDVMDDVEDL